MRFDIPSRLSPGPRRGLVQHVTCLRRCTRAEMCPVQDPSRKREVPERSDFKSSAMCGTPRMLHQAPFGAQGENPERMSSRTTNFNPREEFCLSIVDSPSVTLVVAWLLTSHEGTLAAMVEPRHCTVQHSEGLVQGVLQGSLDQAVRASELGAEPGRDSRMSAADMAGIDSLAAPPVSSAAPEAFVDSGHVSRHSAEGPVSSAAAEAFVDSGHVSRHSAEGYA